jgi:hypothetical protein
MLTPPNETIHDLYVLPAVREVYSRRPETRGLEPWELQHVLFSLGYTADLAPEADIAAAVEVARTDWDQTRGRRERLRY